jgi:hypothetical protein
MQKVGQIRSFGDCHYVHRRRLAAENRQNLLRVDVIKIINGNLENTSRPTKCQESCCLHTEYDEAYVLTAQINVTSIEINYLLEILFNP